MRTLGDYAMLLLTILGSVASIFGFGIYFAPWLNNQGWVGVLFLGLFSFFFLIQNFYLISKYSKKTAYAEIFHDINIGFSNLHSINRNNDINKDAILLSLGFLCDSLSIAFGKIYKTNIGVCIKFLTYEGARPVVLTLMRDRNSKLNRKTGVADETIHYLDQNSDFKFIQSNLEQSTSNTSFYYEPKLPIRKDYMNTRLPNNWPPPQQKIWGFENIVRRRLWPLQYRSTLVVPIIPLLANEQKKDKIRGFLCVDSPKEDIFNDKLDTIILKGICDGLYNHIDKLYLMD